MEVQALAHGSVSRFKPSPASALQRFGVRRVRVAPTSILISGPNSEFSFRNSLRINAAHSRIKRCGYSGAYEPSSSYHCLSSNSLIRVKPSPIWRSRAWSRLVVRSGKESKGKDAKGKKKSAKGGGGGGGGGGSKGEATKRGGPRPNVWSKDIAETEYQASKTEHQVPRGGAKPPIAKQQGRDGDLRGKGGWRDSPKNDDNGDFDHTGRDKDPFEVVFQDFGDDFTGAIATGGILVQTQQVLQAPEQMASPLWPTFVSSNAGVWRGFGAAFNPITAEMEPVALDVSKAYLYDAAVLCSVESIPGPEGNQIEGTSLYRKVMWKVGNTRGELGYKEFQEDLELFGEDLEDEEDSSVEGINPIELESSAIAEGMAYPPETTGGEFGTVEETKEFLEGSESRADAFYNPEKENSEDWVLKEGDPEWESMFKAGTVDTELVEELKNVPEAINNTVPTASGESAPASNVVWKDVMEEDTMTLEPGLVFFSDGSYSRGPVSLLPDDLAETEPAYFNAPTFKIEQCIVTGKHRRVRLVHTIAIMESGEEIQVLRVAVYEEQWMGPRNMESISESTEVLANLVPFSQRDRSAVNELAGSWKVFEMSATAIHQPDATLETRPSYAHFCQELLLEQGLPEPLKMYLEDGELDGEPAEDPTVLWLPAGITASVQAKEDGILTVGIGWFYEEGTFLAMERDYGPDGKLSEVRSQTKVKGGWAGGSM